MSDEERLESAFQCVLTNPEYRFGDCLRGRGNPLPPSASSEVYKKATGRTLF